jgi:L-alanine-DL-glutamate epimerase-like enolase superfamily enzyme
MQISRVEPFALTYKEPHYRGLERCVTLVRIEADNGAVGWGEGISQFREAAIATKVVIAEGLGSLVMHQDPLDVELIWHKLCRHAYWYGVEGIAAFAISAIDMALWDLKGKILGQPVAKLLGGKLRDEVPAMASIIFDMNSLEWTLGEFQSFKEAGYGIVKGGWGMRPDAVFGQDRTRDLKYVTEVRRTIGEDISLVVDVPGASHIWDVPTAIQFALDRAASAAGRSRRTRPVASRR